MHFEGCCVEYVVVSRSIETWWPSHGITRAMFDALRENGHVAGSFFVLDLLKMCCGQFAVCDC